MYGYIAQDYQGVFPEEVTSSKFGSHTGEEILSITTDGAATYTTAAVQQLIRDKEQLERTVDDLRKATVRQEDRLLKLEKMMNKK